MENVDKLKKLVAALDSMVELGEDLLADGKVDFTDIQHLPKLAPIASELMDCWKNKEEMLLEVRDLDYNEVIELVSVIK
jgi:hypothetical protein